MEILLAILLAAAIVAAAWLFGERKDALSRERRLRHEIGGMKRASLTPPASTSSPDLRPLFPEPPGAASPAPEPPAALLPPEAEEEPRPSPSLPAHLLDEAFRHRDALAALDEKLAAPPPPGKPSSPSVPVPPPQDRDPGGERLAASVAGVGSAIEPFVDQSTRLRSDLEAVEAATGRVLAALQTALPLAREASRQTEALSPLVSSLSGIEDRLNLLSLDVSLAAQPAGTRPAADKEASVEIRALFDEMRAFSRDLGARVRRATESARRTEEAFSALRETVDGARERSAAASGRGGQLTAIALRLEEEAGSLRTASDTARLECEKLGRLKAALEQRLSVELVAAQRLAHEAAASTQARETAREVVREERQAAEELAESLRSIARR